jgi:formylglycine-generating enzyme required for sulfatase activity
MCSTSQRTACNGDEHDSAPGTPGNQDALFPTGSPTFPTCNAEWAPAGRVYDLSGNVREWTNTQRVPGQWEIRGGAYTTIEAGRACDFDFVVGDASFRFENTGFRCCLY